MSAQMTLKFTASAEWVTDKACSDVENRTRAKAKANRNNRNNSGTLVLTAETRDALEAAHRFLMADPVYKHHFTT